MRLRNCQANLRQFSLSLSLSLSLSHVLWFGTRTCFFDLDEEKFSVSGSIYSFEYFLLYFAYMFSVYYELPLLERSKIDYWKFYLFVNLSGEIVAHLFIVCNKKSIKSKENFQIHQIFRSSLEENCIIYYVHTHILKFHNFLNFQLENFPLYPGFFWVFKFSQT